MANEVIHARMQTPKDSYGNRKDIHYVTSSEDVIYGASNVKETLDSYSDIVHGANTLTIASTKPADKVGMWFNTGTKLGK